MNKKIVKTFILTSLISMPVYADFAFTQESDYTGEAFFTPYVEQPQSSIKSGSSSHHGSVPPVKLMRLKIQEKLKQRDDRRYELAPTAQDVYEGEIETSEYASKEVVDEFEEMQPDDFQAEEFAEDVEKPKKSFFKRKSAKAKKTEENQDIILDCDNVDYDTQNYLIKATGDVSVEFVKQGTIVKAGTITFDRLNNTVMAEGDVKIIKAGQTITGDYIFVD